MSVLTTARTGYGLAQLVAPEGWRGRADPGQEYLRWPDRHGSTVIRVLGARHLAQAALSEPSPTSAVLAVGAAVDLLHAASMVGLAAVDRRWRRAALADGTVAFAFAAVGMRAAQLARRRPPTETRALLRARDRWAQALAHSIAPRLFPAGNFAPPAQPHPTR